MRINIVINMDNNYWIYEDCFIFKPVFNEPIDKYVEIIKKYKKLIFENYNNLELCIEINNKHNLNYNNYIGSKFNQSLSNSLNNLTQLTHLSFGFEFD